MTPLLRRAREGRVGFRISEVMDGEHEFRDGRSDVGPHPIELSFTWGPDRLRDWLDPTGARFLWQEGAGELRVAGLCGWTPCEGTLELEYFSRRRIRYSLDFEVEGVPHRFVGDKVDLRLWNLPVSHTTCHGTITELETGKLVSTAVLRFRLRHLPRLLLSLRPA